MPPVIRINDDTWEILKTWAVPLEDSVDDALRRALRSANEHRNCAKLAQPLDDSPNDEPRDVVDAGKVFVDILIPDQLGQSQTDRSGAKAKRERLPRGKRLPQKDYELPILESLYELKGSAKAKNVLGMVETRVKHLLTDIDYQILSDGREPRWRKTANFARRDLVNRGLLASDSEWGVWELTDEGIAEVEKGKVA